MDFVALLSGVTGALQVVKELKDIDHSLQEGEYRLKISELQIALADAKDGIVTARVEALEREAEIKRLREALAFRDEETTIHGGYRYRLIDGSPEGRPYCTACEAAKGLFVMMTRAEGPRGTMQCPHCRAEYRNVHEL